MTHQFHVWNYSEKACEQKQNKKLTEKKKQEKENSTELVNKYVIK